MGAEEPGKEPEDRGLVTRIGPLEIDWPKSIGYYGGVALAVAFELIEPPLAIFIAAIPLVKLVKTPRDPWPVRVVADVIEGAAKPVGGDAESVVRVSDAASGNGNAVPRRRPGRTAQSRQDR